MGQVSIFCILLITAWLALLGSGTPGVCYEQRYRYVRHTRSRQSSRESRYGCGWWGKRCRRTHYYTTYYTTNDLEYYQQQVCCPGYTDYGGACRKTVIRLERPSYDVNEDRGSVTVCARVHENVGIDSRGIYVEMRTVNGGARSSSDYSLTSSVKRFMQQTTRHCLTIPIHYDYTHENSETFQVVLRGRSMPPYASLSLTTTTISIHDVYRIRIGFFPPTYRVNEAAGTVSVCAKVYDYAGTVQETQVSLSTSSSGARSPHDFTATSSRITFTPSSRRHCVSIPIVHDHLHEDTESFSVHLTSSLPHVTVDPATATVYIWNGNRVTIGFEQTGIQVAENAGNVPVCVRILQPAAADARLGSDSFRVGMRTQQTADGARASEDFFHRSQIVTLSSAVRHQCLIIPIVHDTLFERTEAFNVSLFRSPSLPSYVTLAPNMAVVRITHVHEMTIGFEQTSISVHESAGHVPICVKVLQPTSPSASIEDTHYSVAFTTSITPGPNRAGAQDLTVVSTILTLTSLSRRLCVSIPITQDHILEPHESFTVILQRSSLPSYVVLLPNTARVTIFDA